MITLAPDCAETESQTADADFSEPDGTATKPKRGDLKEVARYLKDHKLIVTTAESCTAGLIAAHLADVPGAGKLLECAFVVYSPEAKQQRLGVSPNTIERFNLTSEQVAREMACGALKNSGANVAVANTGVTDDTDPDIPAGTQCFAWCFAPEGIAEPCHIVSDTQVFEGDRNAIRDQAAYYALSEIPARHAAWQGANG
jgi:nicotinamide-nucleotide amidase